MSRATYIPPPKFLPNSDMHRMKIADALAQAMQGRVNVTNTIRFDASGTTILIDPRIHPQSFIDLSPRSLLAAWQQWWIESKKIGKCTIRHGAFDQEVIEFDVLIIG